MKRVPFVLPVLCLFALAMVPMLPTAARAITFGEWATAQGYDPVNPMPDSVSASSATIDSLTGIGAYDWLTTPTTSLNLYNNQITSIESGDFSGLGSLTYLGLYNNQITSIESGDFSGLGSLTSLGLGGNEITSIESGDFSGLGSLTYLGLYNNQITSVESGDFSGLGSLPTLDLSQNHITSIESGDFTGLGSLTTLNLNYNDITSIEPGDFSGMGSLTSLYLNANQITSIESDDFSGLGSLTYLGLGENEITSIESSDFSELDSLTGLSLKNTPITSIESGAFSGMGKLRSLYLYDNVALTTLNLNEADFSSLTRFDVKNNTSITSVSLRSAVLNQTSLEALIDGGPTSYIGIGQLPAVTALDLGGIDFSAITDLSPLWVMDDLTELWIVEVENLDATDLDTLLDNLATIEDPGTEGILYMAQAEYDAFNAAGGGLLAAWNAEAGHHVEGPVPGDANSDGVVNEVDAQILANNWGRAWVTWFDGDLNNDGIVNAADAAILAANWGSGTSESNAVPEPSALGLLIIGAIGLLAFGWRRLG